MQHLYYPGNGQFGTVGREVFGDPFDVFAEHFVSHDVAVAVGIHGGGVDSTQDVAFDRQASLVQLRFSRHLPAGGGGG